MKTIIVGGVAGGASAAARLRRLDEHAEIILLERGAYISFANCGLPYYIGGVITEREVLTLQSPAGFRERFCVDVRTLSEAVDLDADSKTLTIQSIATGERYTEQYDALILAPGAAPFRPNIPGLNLAGVFTLRNLSDTFAIDDFIRTTAPQSAVVVGGGFIGLEMAENFSHKGIRVTVVERMEQVLAPLDFEMAADVQNYLREQGVRLRLGCAIEGIAQAQTGFAVSLSGGETLHTDMVQLAIGVNPELTLAKKAGLTITPLGAIEVNPHMQTSDPSIYAVGDAISVTHYLSRSPARIPLAGPANKQGRIAADNIAGRRSTYKGTQGSSIVKLFDMTVACTGLNERAAIAAEISYDKVYLTPASHAGYYPNATNMLMKVLFEKETGWLLGAQIVGYEGVDKRMDVLATAIRFNATARDLTELELCYAPPYSSAKDPANMAGYIITNVMDKLVRQFHWHEVDTLPRDGSVALVDVRTKEEYAAGHIDGFCNIPLHTLRARMGELESEKTVYLHCYSGQRSYIACRILQAHGFTCCNLAGGYRLYNAVKKAQGE